ncbi:hypothetical protein DFH11DRAFT_108652 [Phellopilus nigrolimitatus]|nr:hypothetical protein DFH11DRAFT_108652 [Phellopilus nigrolimitatus]
MTEYDYSPDAYEKYMVKQRAIARWVDRQSYEAPRYGNPFLPSEYGDPPPAPANPPTKPLVRSASTPVDPRAVSGQSHSRTRDRHNYHHAHHHRGPSNASSQTLVQTYGAPAAPRASAGPSSSSPPHSRPHSHSRSGARAHSRPPPARSQTYAHASQPAFSSSQVQLSKGPVRSATLPAQTQTLIQSQPQPHYPSAPGHPVVMTHGHQTYVVIPAPGTRVEVRSPQSTSPTHASPYASQAAQTYQSPAYASPSQPVSPTKKQPLFKRIFGSSSGTGSGAGSQGSHYPMNANALRRKDAPVLPGGGRRRTTSMHY